MPDAPKTMCPRCYARLGPLQRRVVDAIDARAGVHEPGATTTELRLATKLEITALRAALKKLLKAGFIARARQPGPNNRPRLWRVVS